MITVVVVSLMGLMGIVVPSHTQKSNRTGSRVCYLCLLDAAPFLEAASEINLSARYVGWGHRLPQPASASELFGTFRPIRLMLACVSENTHQADSTGCIDTCGCIKAASCILFYELPSF